MRISAKIMLNAGISTARNSLAGLADGSWLMSLPQHRDPYNGHPAGSAWRVLSVPSGRTFLIAVTFGTLSPAGGPTVALPVRWEPLEPSDECAFLLDGDIALTPLSGHARSILTLAGTCQMLPAVRTDDCYQQARLQVEAAQSFIASVATILAGSPGPGYQPLEPAWSWVTGQPKTP